jgi:hypothetical protein
MIRRRQVQVFSLSFLDCICCGFGAIILIFVLTIDSHGRKEKFDASRSDEEDPCRAALPRSPALKTSKEDRGRSNNTRVTRLVTDSRLRNDSLQALIDESAENAIARRADKKRCSSTSTN